MASITKRDTNHPNEGVGSITKEECLNLAKAVGDVTKLPMVCKGYLKEDEALKKRYTGAQSNVSRGNNKRAMLQRRMTGAGNALRK
mmetsp:Transcript_9531/g.14622  ORF Transcript_9531/g.14622 Transcript_9531/m.14622 type:complete len:86 (-) Transcript_9531:213-470(-)